MEYSNLLTVLNK